MFTFGREHEIRHAVGFVNDKDKAKFLTDVINAVHDLLEEKITLDQSLQIFKLAFSEGKSGVWETTGSWVRKLSSDYPTIIEFWTDLSLHSKASVRYRVACFLDEIPNTIAVDLGHKLTADSSKKVKEMAMARLGEIGS